MEIEFNVGDVVGYCPKCNRKLVVRNGKYGKFIGCYGYPECKMTYNLKKYVLPERFREIKKLDKIETYGELKKVIEETDDELIREKANQKLTDNNYCTCGHKIRCKKVLRLQEDYQEYLKEYNCPNCGYFIIRETPERQEFFKMGTLQEYEEGSDG